MIGSKSDISRSIRANGEIDAMGKKRKYTNRSYRRYFEGYTRYAVPKENGKGAEYILLYTEDYYRLDCSNRRCLCRKWLYTGAALAVLALFVFQGTRSAGYNTAWYVALPQACAVPFLAVMATAVFHVVEAERDMTAHSYRISSRRLIVSSLGAAAILALEALSLLAYALRQGQPVGDVLAVSLCYTAMAAVTAAVGVAEKKARFVRVESKAEPPAGAIEIDRIE